MGVVTVSLDVASDGTISAIPPLPPGKQVARVKFEIDVLSRPATLRFDGTGWPLFDIDPLPPGAIFSREEIYGAEGR